MEKKKVNETVKTAYISLLGGFRIEVDGSVLTDEDNRSQKLWNVLAYLLLHRDRSISQAEFIDVFWSDSHSANPVNALKTLLYRVRAMLAPLFGAELQPILARRGSYSWNEAIHCVVDADRFERLCAQGAERARTWEDRVTSYEAAIQLYKGDPLPKLGDQLWLVPLTTHYRTRYIQAIKQLSALLYEREKFGQIVELCAQASQLDPLDEELHVLVSDALLRLGDNTAALARYECATELLYRNLGVRPSEALRRVYLEIMGMEQGLETDMEVIQEELRGTASRPGAFLCEYGFFREAYRLEARRIRRSGISVHVGLVTVSLPNGGLPSPKVLAETMDQLSRVLVSSLRRGDVVAKYSAAQFVLLLPSANYEDSDKVMERVVSAFYQQHRHHFLKLTTKVRELELD